METEMKHFNHYHRHPLILKEKHHAEGDFACYFCEKEILCKTSVYTCQVEDCAFFLHKKCADFPIRFTHPNHTHLLKLSSVVNTPYWAYCDVCHNRIYSYHGYGYDCDVCDFEMCLKCAVKPGTTIQHWSHKHRPLRYVERCATFKCDACNTVAADSSYRCDDNTCPFWIHQSCATLPQTKLFRIHHKHPLNISDSLHQMYRGFTQFCKICCEILDKNQWLYYCANCRFFAHISCALSTTPVSSYRDDLDDPKLMHLPPSDQQSMNLMMQKCIKDMISLSMDITVVPPDHINHWAHEQHPLALRTKSVATYDGINQEPERLIICDGCVKPISPSLDDSEVFYECRKCNFFLHTYCALFPNEMHHQLLGMLKGGFVFPGNIRRCDSCKFLSNGFMFEREYGEPLDVCCACLPENIMHIGHHHALKQYTSSEMIRCNSPTRSDICPKQGEETTLWKLPKRYKRACHP